MADIPMKRVVIGSKTYEIVDEYARENIGENKDILMGLYPIETASGPIAVIHDGADDLPVRDLSVAIEPVQTFNGYDRQWAGGAGKNKLENTAVTTTKQGLTYTVNTDGTVSVSGTATANSYMHIATSLTFPEAVVVNGVPTPVASGVNIQVVAGGTYYNDTGDGVTIPANTTITEVRMRINNGITVNKVVFKPMIRKASETDATYEPYSNICPISGHTEIKTYVSDGNLISARKNWYTKADGTIEASTLYGAVIFPVQQGKTYSLLIERNVNPNRAWAFYEEYPQNDSVSYDRSRVLAQDTTITAPINGWCLYRDLVANTIQSVVEGSTAKWSEEAKVHSIDLPTTVYGGTLDVTKGILTVDRAMVDLGTLTYTRETSGSVSIFRATIPSRQTGDGVTGISSQYGFFGTGSLSRMYTMDDGQFGFQGTNTFIAIRDDRYTDVDSFKTAVTGQTLVYPLATPQTYTLSPVQVKTLLGENRIYADAGDVTVEYRVDFNEAGLMYIPKAPTADGTYRLTVDVAGGTPTYRWEIE